jgi:hypothetical protein
MGVFITWFQDYWLSMHSVFVILSRRLVGTSKYLVSEHVEQAVNDNARSRPHIVRIMLVYWFTPFMIPL